MNKRPILFSLFILMALIQLYIPAKMIFDREDILHSGTEYKFKTAAIDPYDPFRGKYITLDFEADRIRVENQENWKLGESAYVIFRNDSTGFTQIADVLKEKPEDGVDYLKAKVEYVSYNELFIHFPFDRFYMEESKAYEAELALAEFQADSSGTAYALVSIKEGDAVLKDVYIDGVSIKEVVEKGRRGE